jgi:hypothetical protein
MGFEFQHGTPEQLKQLAADKVSKGRISKYLPKRVQDFMASRQASSAMASRQLAEEGMTSLPGLAKGYFGGGASGSVTPWQAAKMNVKAPGLAMGAGIPALMSAQAIKEYKETGDKRRLGESLAGNIGFGLGGALPITAMMGLGAATGAAGRLVGKGVEAVGSKLQPPVQQPVGQVVPR